MISADCDIMVDNVTIEQRNEFVYLGNLFTRDSKSGSDIKRCNFTSFKDIKRCYFTAGDKINGALMNLVKIERILKKHG